MGIYFASSIVDEVNSQLLFLITANNQFSHTTYQFYTFDIKVIGLFFQTWYFIDAMNE